MFWNSYKETQFYKNIIRFMLVQYYKLNINKSKYINMEHRNKTVNFETD